VPFAWNATAAEVLPSRWARRSEEHVRNAVSFTTYKGLIAGNQGMQVSIDARNAGQKNAASATNGNLGIPVCRFCTFCTSDLPNVGNDANAAWSSA
jgi:hypothetical protein